MKAAWIRAYDETYSDRHFREVLPTGEKGEYVRNKPERKGEEGPLATAAWSSGPIMTSAILALESNGDRDMLSEAMGDQHKVRAFFNNILDPSSPNDDVTMDTHAFGAALLRPLSTSTIPVMHGLALSPGKKDKPKGWQAAPNSIKTGNKGLYGLYATAYRELAGELGIEARQLQSVTWEAKRMLFDRNIKKATRDAIEVAWKDYHVGKLTLAETQQRVLELGGGVQ